jgi:hypothetical protein
MRRALLYLILFAFLLPSCTRKAAGSTTVIKPKNHSRFFVKEKDRYKKRTKVVRMKN